MTPAREFTVRLADLLRREHAAMADFLVALADFDRRRLWLELGHASLFYYLHRELGLSKGAAFYRKTAAELVQKFPEVVEPLRDGRLCVTSVVHLAKVLTPENREELLPRFFHRSRREAMEVVAAILPAARAPRREVVTAVRCTGPVASSGTAKPVAGPAGHAVRPAELWVDPVQEAGRPAEQEVDSAQEAVQPAELGVDPAQVAVQLDELRVDPAHVDARPASLDASRCIPSSPSADGCDRPPGLAAEPMRSSPPPSPPRPRSRDSAEPLGAELSRLHVTVSRRFLSKLEAARAALSHSRPGATIEDVLEAGLDLILARDAKRKGQVEKPRATIRPAKPDHVPARVKREVWKRDGGRCTWPLASGGTCGSTVRVELDHVVPRARGGPSTTGNVRLLCAVHNQYAARLAFGDDFMDRFTRRSPAPEGARLGSG